MANIKSQKKRNLTNEKDRQQNQAVRSRMKTVVKQALTVKETKDADKTKSALNEALSSIDRAVTKGVLHRNAAARKKSSLQRLINA
jgi:small subunit ribosomal protein S20